MVMNLYIRHSAKGTTWSKADAKYIRKIKVNGKWRYFYSTEEHPRLFGRAEDNATYVDGAGNEVFVTTNLAPVPVTNYVNLNQPPSYLRNHSHGGFKWVNTEGYNRGQMELSLTTRYMNPGVIYVNELSNTQLSAIGLGLTNSAIGKKRKDRGH